MKKILSLFFVALFSVGLWAGEFYNMYISYSFNGADGDMIGSDKGTGFEKDLGTLTGTFTLTSVYLKCWDNVQGSTYGSQGGQLGYTNTLDGGTTNHYVSCPNREDKNNGDTYQWYNNNPGVTFASYTDASGSYKIDCWGQTWDWDGNGGSNGDWYFPYGQGHYVLKYKIAPPAVSGFNVSTEGSNIKSGTGDENDPYIISSNGSLILTLSGDKAHEDANSDLQYYTDAEWNTTASRTISNITSTTKTSVTVKMRCHNSTADLSGAESTKTIYYQAEDGSATALNNTAEEGKAVKRIVNGQLVIEREGKMYNALGAEVK